MQKLRCKECLKKDIPCQMKFDFQNRGLAEVIACIGCSQDLDTAQECQHSPRWYNKQTKERTPIVGLIGSTLSMEYHLKTFEDDKAGRPITWQPYVDSRLEDKVREEFSLPRAKREPREVSVRGLKASPANVGGDADVPRTLSPGPVSASAIAGPSSIPEGMSLKQMYMLRLLIPHFNLQPPSCLTLQTRPQWCPAEGPAETL